MDTIIASLKFLNSYPTWAKVVVVGALLIAVITLVFATRSVSRNGAASDSIFLTISGVKLFPENSSAEIQVIAYVNDTAFQYPSVGGVTWLKVGPVMAPQIIEIPKADLYVTRFELNLKLPDTVKKLVSQTVLRVTELPFNTEYNLYPLEGQTRAASISAVVKFSISKSP